MDQPYAEGVGLRRTDENEAGCTALAARCGGAIGLDGVLAGLDRQARRLPLAWWRLRQRRVVGRAASYAFTWDDEDADDPVWWPQGVTSSADSGEPAGRRLLVTSAYAKAGDKHAGSRVSVVDLDTLRYAHVLLAVPSEDGADLAPLPVHAGGIVWRGPYLHVGATARGIATCRWDDVVRVDGRFVLPVRFEYAAATDEGATPMRYSFLSLEHGAEPPGLVVGEYGRGDMTRRLVRYEIDPATSLLSTREEGVARPWLHDPEGPAQMQGAVVAQGRWYLTSSRGPQLPSTAYVGAPGAWEERPAALPIGVEDVCWWPEEDRLWTLGEYPGRRVVVAIDRSRLA